MTPEEKLHALFSVQTPPVRDLAFRAAVAERIARRRAVSQVVTTAPVVIAGTAALWGLQPVLTTLGPALAPSATALALCALVAATALWTARRVSAA
ncbi:MAG: hypothetical protein EON91_06310 [Brevundimonas sp.]|uniref:hypothetical protein n=1 Tax=Brevundimonas sp. TaxID=1871086 RepID=UPI00120CA6C5|nr:hypothetical protein [Brevundimonas sp.]RZJ18167.1 MAG: hypothetical protein EON91_06310 [Brevundimonas sp.]